MNDTYMSDQISALAPHKSFLDPNKPRSVTSVASIPKPVASTISSWIAAKEPYNNSPEDLAFLQSLSV